MAKQVSPPVPAKIPTVKETAKAIKGKPHRNDSDLIHGEGSPIDHEKAEAVTIIKTEKAK